MNHEDEEMQRPSSPGAAKEGLQPPGSPTGDGLDFPGADGPWHHSPMPCKWTSQCRGRCCASTPAKAPADASRGGGTQLGLFRETPGA